MLWAKWAWGDKRLNVPNVFYKHILNKIANFEITPNYLVVTFMFSKPVNELANEEVHGVVNKNEITVLNSLKANSRITKKQCRKS